MAFRRGIRNRKGKEKKTPKYKNKIVFIDGIKFVSKKEGDRYLFLKKCEEEGLISNLELQPKFELIPSVTEEYVVHLKTKDKIKTRVLQLAINYVGDFKYLKNGEEVIEDVKGHPTTVTKEFELKNKLFFWKFGKKIRLIFDAEDPI
jgi:hypothetical protein